MTHENRLKYLKIGSAFIFLSGVAAFLSLFTPLSAVMNVFLDTATLPNEETQYLGDGTFDLLVAILGGITAGFGALFYMISTEVYVENPQKGRHILLVGIWTWFIIDGIGSVISGNWFNVVLNLSFLGAIALPLLGDKSEAALKPVL